MDTIATGACVAAAGGVLGVETERLRRLPLLPAEAAEKGAAAVGEEVTNSIVSSSFAPLVSATAGLRIGLFAADTVGDWAALVNDRLVATSSAKVLLMLTRKGVDGVVFAAVVVGEPNSVVKPTPAAEPVVVVIVPVGVALKDATLVTGVRAMVELGVLVALSGAGKNTCPARLAR